MELILILLAVMVLSVAGSSLIAFLLARALFHRSNWDDKDWLMDDTGRF